MKKSILLLLVLLITLIGTCIYKKAYLPSIKEKSRESSPKDKRHIVVKTHTLYPIDHSIEVKAVAKVEPKPVVAKEPIEKKELPQVKEPIKEKEIVAPKKIYPTIQPMPIVVPTEVAKVEPKPMVAKESIEKKELPQVKEPIKEKEIVAPKKIYPTIQPMPIVAPTPIEVTKVEPKPVVAKEPIKEKEIVAPKKIYPTIQPMPIVAPTPIEVTKVEPKPMIQTKVQSQTEQEIKEVTTPIKQQQEQINLLLDALQDRDNAMQSRQAFIEKIEDFINASLENRLNVIRTMGKYQINMDRLQEKIMETRDTIYIQISKPNTSTLGE